MLKKTSSEFSLMSHEGYKVAWHRLQELRGQRDELSRKAEELRRARPEGIKTQRERQVDAIVQGRSPDEVKSEDKWLTDLNEARARARLFEEAARKQEDELKRQQVIASKEIAQEVAPKYKAIVQKMAKQMITLGEIALEEINLRQSLNDEQIMYGVFIRPMVLPGGLGDPRDHASRMNQWLMEAIIYNFISLNDLPGEWRSKLEPFIKAKKSVSQTTKTSQTKKAEPIPVSEGWNA